MTATPLARAENQSLHGPVYPEDSCLKAVRQCWGKKKDGSDVVPAHDFTPGNGRDPLAREAWEYADHKHPVMNAAQRAAVPANVPGFFTSNRNPAAAGHVVLCAGGDACRSTDINRTGRLDAASISHIEKTWDMTFVGWTEDLNTVRIYTAPPAPKPPTRITRARELLVLAAAHAGPIRRAAIKAALKLLPKR